MTIEDFYTNIFLKYPTVSTDTRSIIPQSIFFALRGANFNGNDFAIQAINQGAVYAVVDSPELNNEPHCIVVENVLRFLQNLANYHRKKCSAKVIGITGTNGKTTTKELIAAVLSKKYTVLYTKGNLNNHIGVPLTLLSIKPETEIAVIEMGANHTHEIAELSAIVEPDYGIITNIGKGHIEGFGSFENVIKTKLELYTQVASTNGILFQDLDNDLLTTNTPKGVTVCSYSIEHKSNVCGTVHQKSFFAAFTLSVGNDSIDITSQLFGNYNIKNMLAAACIGNYFAVPLLDIKNALESYSPSNNRSQLQKTQNNTLILDMYNANPTSMRAALEQFVTIANLNSAVILGEMYELGEISYDEHSKIIEFVRNSSISKILLVGNWPKVEDSKIQYFIKSTDLLEYLSKESLHNYTILIKGSRGVKLETVLPSL
ncbi:MAG TPA: UDP-N-acetylmuramoyl-tripeptide--D-alanyl-D-alanine ligase [Bacteroidales bacterium]|jgi:UDP-N-acetylmuramoyl-tripeptide--D-alanyl-D-alanine ligase|nr:UDP-N-acetylmuramoyl-tripeptide--D-alanyl-D-alanine ligase [Bacteroidales bacterium]